MLFFLSPVKIVIVVPGASKAGLLEGLSRGLLLLFAYCVQSTENNVRQSKAYSAITDAPLLHEQRGPCNSCA